MTVLNMSSAGIWGAPRGCRANPVLAPQVAGRAQDDTAALEGIETHAIAERMARALFMTAGYGRDPLYDVGNDYPRADIIGTTGSSAFITAEMYESAEVYALDIEREIKAVSSVQHLIWAVEYPVVGVNDSNRGKIDAFLLDPVGRHLIIWDFKNGQRYVDEFENWQLINYAMGVIRNPANVLGEAEDFKVTLRIVQPNCYSADGPVRDWVTSSGELRAHFNVLSNSSAEVHSGNLTARTGGHCRFCPAIGQCETAIRQGLDLIELIDTTRLVDPSTEDMALMYAKVLRAYDHVKELKSVFAEQLEATARSGTSIPGFEMKPGRSSTKWALPAELVNQLGDSAGIDLRKNGLITPKQAIDKGLTAEAVAAYSTTVPGKLSLKPINQKNLKKVFKS